MTAKLLIDSPLRSWAYSLPLEKGKEYKGGSTSRNAIQLAPSSSTPEHIVFFQRGDRWHIKDVSGTNSLFVDGKKVLETALKHGDAIKVGGCDLVFQNPDEVTGAHDLLNQARTRIAEREFALREVVENEETNTIRIEGLLDTAITEDAKKQPAKPANASSTALNIGALVKKELHSKDLVWVAGKLAAILAEALNQEGRDQIFDVMLKQLREAIGADNGFVMVPNPQTNRWLIRAWTGDPSQWTKFGKTQPVPMTVANRAFETGRIVSNATEGIEDEGIGVDPSQSMLALNVHSYIAVPLVEGSKRRGVVYFDTRNPATEFHGRDVKLLERAGSYILEIENQGA